MLHIREAQRLAMRRVIRETFVQRMVSRLRQREVEPCREWSDPALTEIVQAGIEQAEGFGIKTRGSVEAFLVAVVRLGPDFASRPEHAEIRHVLDMQGLDGRAKVDMLQVHMAELAAAPEP